ncbi:D-ribose pyranase [Nonomuraea dietziae]|uniref:D-ribose pyranase n=1 Tax=Nonomuraea dietziae TaxID=65515 RepID=A0A7W5UZZ5_9ACTN|nr:D-ribose pyranase [Nonomuraea dietziae]MBB3726179.1 D-ribose pyranase [Nonomuraea dietziae]
MKRSGILNAALAGQLARLGHTDRVLVCDSGMPIPAGVEVVDLAFVAGVPSFAEVLDGLLAELVVEGAVAASEVGEANPACAGPAGGAAAGPGVRPARGAQTPVARGEAGGTDG